MAMHTPTMRQNPRTPPIMPKIRPSSETPDGEFESESGVGKLIVPGADMRS